MPFTNCVVSGAVVAADGIVARALTAALDSGSCSVATAELYILQLASSMQRWRQRVQCPQRS
jgi:hypothetical protein